MVVFVGNVFCFLSSLLRLVLVLFFLFVASFPNSVSCSLTGFFPGIILNKCDQILFLQGFSVFNAVNDDIILHWHLLHSSLSGGNKFLGLYTGKKKLCKRDSSGGRVFSGCPGCYLGNIRVYPYNRDEAIISFLLGMLLALPVVR